MADDMPTARTTTNSEFEAASPARSTVQPRMLRIEVNGLLHDWFDVDELGDMLKAPGFAATFRENIARYFGVPADKQALYDEDGLIATTLDLSRALQRYAPKLIVHYLDNLSPDLRDKTVSQLSKVSAEVEQCQRCLGSAKITGSTRQTTSAGTLVQKQLLFAQEQTLAGSLGLSTWTMDSADTRKVPTTSLPTTLDSEAAVTTDVSASAVATNTCQAALKEETDSESSNDGQTESLVPEALRHVADAVQNLKRNQVDQLPAAPKAPSVRIRPPITSADGQPMTAEAAALDGDMSCKGACAAPAVTVATRSGASLVACNQAASPRLSHSGTPMTAAAPQVAQGPSSCSMSPTDYSGHVGTLCRSATGFASTPVLPAGGTASSMSWQPHPQTQAMGLPAGSASPFVPGQCPGQLSLHGSPTACMGTRSTLPARLKGSATPVTSPPVPVASPSTPQMPHVQPHGQPHGQPRMQMHQASSLQTLLPYAPGFQLIGTASPPVAQVRPCNLGGSNTFPTTPPVHPRQQEYPDQQQPKLQQTLEQQQQQQQQQHQHQQQQQQMQHPQNMQPYQQQQPPQLQYQQQAGLSPRRQISMPRSSTPSQQVLTQAPGMVAPAGNVRLYRVQG
eukprot:TRINITY_DN14048_c0_g1_i1.p1 TRINITY_DN14048_c0_g1~~TRINITY_DN14048_c0_g1_i1.p1  ORF type:complete len:644 (-),score=136.89 TRINITY_DN14048_c0_g1_i1:57-1919(-)